MYLVYILKSVKFRKTYTGITDNLQRRLDQHNNGNSEYSSRYLPWEILYKETVLDRNAARMRERYFKSAAGRRWIKRNLFNNFVRQS